MAATSRGVICEMIQRALLNSFMSDDSDFSLSLINQYLNAGIGVAIRTSYKDEIQINGAEGVADAFYATFTSMTITADSTMPGNYLITLPQQTVGIGAGWDISSFIMVKGSGAKLIGYPITQKEVSYLYTNPKPCDGVFFWTEADRMNIHSCKDLTKYKGRVTMLVSQSNDLDSPMNIPDGYLPIIIDYMIKTLGPLLNIPIDISSDGVDTPKVR